MPHVSLFVNLQSPDPSLHPAAAQSSVSQAPWSGSGSGHFSAGDGNTSVADKLADTQHAAAAETELSAVLLQQLIVKRKHLLEVLCKLYFNVVKV